MMTGFAGRPATRRPIAGDSARSTRTASGRELQKKRPTNRQAENPNRDMAVNTQLCAELIPTYSCRTCIAQIVTAL